MKAKGDKLTLKQKRFAEEYLVDLNATQAAIRAGYSKKTANVQGCTLLTNPNIQKFVQEGLRKIKEITEAKAISAAEKLGITPEYILKGLKEVFERCNSFDEFDATGANKALNLMGQHLSMFTEKVQHSGDKDNPIQNKWTVEIIKPKSKEE